MGDIELIEAVKGGNLANVMTAINSGTNINQQDKHGWTPLNWAAAKGNLEMIDVLLQHGADVFKVGRDMRTPQMIALAAGQVEAVKLLRLAEAKIPATERRSHPERKYCMAYHMRDFRQFPAWKENTIELKAKENGTPAETPHQFSDDDIAYLHQDYVVTKSIWHDEDVIFNQLTPEWKEFCINVLGFKVPDDLDLIVPANRSSQAVTDHAPQQ